MNNEIKEILDDLDYAKNKERGTITLNQKDINLLIDYINNLQEQLHQASLDIQELTEKDIECPSWCDKLTNLQQENEKIRKMNMYEHKYGSDMEEKYLIEKSRREKAVKYINCNKQKIISAYGDNEDDDFEICLWEEDIDDLLNILNGGNNE